ncbi:hypothetical protein ABV409_14975 [Flagellimonas sp. DF-77]|uniref:hypothetical protein n=1 Tax=Flagellimonas algarum TaxID=3230298 RepID=UPI003394E5FE
MKRIFVLIFSVAIISCGGNGKNENSQKIRPEAKIDRTGQAEEGGSHLEAKGNGKKRSFFKDDQIIRVFDFEAEPLVSDLKNLSNESLENYRIDERISHLILKKDNYYKLIAYSQVYSNDVYDLITVFGNYDYYSNIILVSINKQKDSIVDFRIIASNLGDADFKTEIRSLFVDETFFQIVKTEKKLQENGQFTIMSSEESKLTIGPNGHIRVEN